MNEIAQDPNALRLSKFGLTCFLATVIILPIGMILLLYFSLPKAADRPLPVSLHLAEVNGRPAIVLKNDSDAPITNIGITLNDWFGYYSGKPLPGGEEMTVDLGSFERKNGIPFDPNSHQLTEIGVYAQLEDRSRGIWERRSEHLMDELKAESTANEAPQS
ncbi:hypothetical protein [Blastopirellula marina]|uniref:Uncharacterized protein n=1 Tax=Blastopirellula marina TaxID=124 RepID=A0A2S8G2P8_9BACT|nr:hypothetical protein [Blastopirellula marina]PQO38414.1 hypothetical protein C5Y98_10140 [Blastopirellula marina]PTL45071.1 hypothetical protein C5Y97_10150 [Blastopirellula marina]